MSKAAIILTDGCEEGEALTIVDIFRRASIICDMVGLTVNKITGAHNIKIRADRILDETLSEYDMVILPGGYAGVALMSNNQTLISVLKKMNDQNKYIGAICAAPVILEKAGLLAGRNYTCYPTTFEKIKEGKWVDDKVVVSGNIITSQGPATAYAFAYTLISLLGENPEKLKERMLYYSAFDDSIGVHQESSLPDYEYKPAKCKAAVLLGEGFEESETVQILDLLRRAGITAHSFSTGESKQVLSMNNVSICADKMLCDEIMDYNIVIVPGGRTASGFISDNRVMDCLKKFNENNKLVAGICSGTSVLHSAGILNGKKVTGYAGYEVKLTGTEFKNDVVVRDDNIITSRGPATPFPFAFCIIEALGIDPELLKQRLLYKLAGGK